jgi:hypothetical protein
MHADAGGVVATISPSVPMFGMVEDRSEKGMIFATFELVQKPDDLCVFQ